MLELFWILIPIALVHSVSPVRFGALVKILADRRPLAGATAFLIGLYASYYLIGLLIALGLDRLLEYLFPSDPEPIDFVIGALVGALLLLFGLKKLRTPKIERETPPRRSDRGASPFMLAVLLNAATGFASLPYLAAIDRIIRADSPDWEMFLALAFYCGVVVSPHGALILFRIALGGRTDRPLKRINKAISSWMPRLTAILFVLLGAVLVVDACGFFFFDRPLW